MHIRVSGHQVHAFTDAVQKPYIRQCVGEQQTWEQYGSMARADDMLGELTARLPFEKSAHVSST